MNYDDDDRNPFADKAIRPATAPPLFVVYFFLLSIFLIKFFFSSNPPTSNEYNPFTSTTIPAQVEFNFFYRSIYLFVFFF
jgi:hypothetical protein